MTLPIEQPLYELGKGGVDEPLPFPLIFGKDETSVDDLLDKHTPIIYIRDQVDDDMAKAFRKAVNTVKYERKYEMVIIDICSPGGSIYSLLDMLSVMKQSQLKFITYCSGSACSAAAVLLSAGYPGSRFIADLGSVMVHGVSFNSGYQPIEDHAAEQELLHKLNNKLMATVAKNCKTNLKSLMKKIKDNGSRNLWLTAEEALQFGIVDNIGTPLLEKIVPDIQHQYKLTNLG